MAPRGAYQVLVDTYVTDDAGTGIVQQAPYFGEVCRPVDITSIGRVLGILI